MKCLTARVSNLEGTRACMDRPLPGTFTAWLHPPPGSGNTDAPAATFDLRTRMLAALAFSGGFRGERHLEEVDRDDSPVFGLACPAGRLRERPGGGRREGRGEEG